MWLIGTIARFANGIADLLAEALTETAGSAEALFVMGLVIATVIGVGVLIRKRGWLADGRQHAQPWICPACQAGNHQRCKGALWLVSRTREGAQPCHCEHCALNR